MDMQRKKARQVEVHFEVEKHLALRYQMVIIAIHHDMHICKVEDVPCVAM